jgi:hypothetical protein
LAFPGTQREELIVFENEIQRRMLMLVFWVVTQCGLAGRYQRFGGTYYIFRTSALKMEAVWPSESLVSIYKTQGVTTQKTNIDIFTAVIT